MTDMKPKLIIISHKVSNNRFNLPRIKRLEKNFEVILLTTGFRNTSDTKSYGCNIKFQKKIISKRKPIINQINLIFFFFLNYKYILNQKPDVVYVHRSDFCWLYPMFLRNTKVILQLFTTDVNNSRFKRVINDFKKNKFPTYFFKYVFVQTEWMAKKLKIPACKCKVVDFGMTPFDDSKKDYSSAPHLIYIGTLNNRNIEETIMGLSIFIKDKPHFANNLKYEIIGSGNENTTNLLKKTIEEHDLNEIVTLHGYLVDDEVEEIIGNANIGIGYVPIVPYYSNVTSTKTYEYLLSGLPVLATNSKDSKGVINSKNGVLCDDNPESFAQGLKEIIEKLPHYNYEDVKSSAKQHSYIECVDRSWAPAIQSVLKD